MLADALLPLKPVPSLAAWRYLLTSAAFNAIYFAPIAEAYACDGLALAYPLMRGTAPMLVAVAAWPLIGETLSALAWVGIAAICAGIIILARRRGLADERKAVRLALANAVIIAAYTLNDAIGARVSGSAARLYSVAVPNYCSTDAALAVSTRSAPTPDKARSAARVGWRGVCDRLVRPRALCDDASPVAPVGDARAAVA